jgi:hypothetical protein
MSAKTPLSPSNRTFQYKTALQGGLFFGMLALVC